MIDDQKCTEVLLKIVNGNTKNWLEKPKFDVVCENFLCAIVATINERRRIQLAVFKKSELDDYLTNSHYPVESRVKRSLLQLQRKFYENNRFLEQTSTTVMPMGITIDTNVINAKGKLKAMNKLEEWHDQEKIQLLVNDIMEDELTTGSLQYHKQGKYIFQCLRPGANYPKLFEKFKKILFPKVAKLNNRQKKDIDHIIAHQKYQEDIFVTNDQNFIRHRNELKNEGALVMTPDECIEFLNKKFNWT